MFSFVICYLPRSDSYADSSPVRVLHKAYTLYTIARL